MKKWFAGLMCLFTVAVLSGCGGGEPATSGYDSTPPATSGYDASPSVTEESAVEGSGAKPMAEEVMEDAVEEATDVMEEAAEEVSDVMEDAVEAIQAAGGAGLSGTQWMLDDVKVDFKDDSMVTLSGGMIAGLGLESLDAEYTVVDGVFTLSAMGQTREGTWDGTTLVVDGVTATPAS